MLDTVLKFATSSIPLGIGFWGQERTNAANAEQAQRQMDFQERMSNTAHQREVADLQAAGLNPALAYFKGGSATPGGAMATMNNSAAAGMTGAAQVASIAQTAAQIEQQRATAGLTRAQTTQLNLESAARVADLQARAATATIGARLADATEALDYNKRQAETYRANIENKFLDKSFPTRLALLAAEVDRSMTSAREGKARATLDELAQPGALSRYLHDRTIWGKYIMPYINDATKVAGSITGAGRAAAEVRLHTGH